MTQQSLDLAQLEAAQTALETGDRAKAREILSAMVRSQQGRVPGAVWWLLGESLDDATQRDDCRRRAAAAGYTPQPSPKPQIPSAPAAPPSQQPQPQSPPPQPASSAAPQPQSPQPAQGGSLSALVSQAAPPAQAPSTPSPIQVPSAMPNPTTDGVMIGRTHFPPSEVSYAIEYLGRQGDRFELIKELMARNDVTYQDADQFVNVVASLGRNQIRDKQRPLMVWVGLSSLIGGVGLMLVMFWYLIGDIYIPFLGILSIPFLPPIIPMVLIVVGLGMAWRGGLTMLRGLKPSR